MILKFKDHERSIMSLDGAQESTYLRVSFILGDLLDTEHRPSAEEYRHGKHWRGRGMGYSFHLPPNELQSLDFSLKSILSDARIRLLNCTSNSHMGSEAHLSSLCIPWSY